MNNPFDELTKGLAQSVTRRAALKRFGLGLAGMALACFGLANSAQAAKACTTDADCGRHKVCKSGRCREKPCQSSADCLPFPQEVCINGTCRPFRMWP